MVAGMAPYLEAANSFDVFPAARRAHGPDAWSGYFDAEEVLAQRIQDVVEAV
tara:strand:+ start:2371 stop:2526 length:156 start_codon:yes stop_codon:yes gene_type:complete